MARIIYTDAAHTMGRMIWDDGECSGPIPPLSGEYRPIYDRLIAEGVAPEPYVAPSEPAPAVDALSFRRLFTGPERRAISEAGYTDPLVRMFMDDAAAAGTLHLDHADVLQGIAYLQAAGLLTQARAKAVLDGKPPA